MRHTRIKNAANMVQVRFRIPQVILLLMVGVMLLTLSCRQTGTIAVGFAASLSGKDYMLGVDGRNAVELFIREANQQGGIQGKQLQLLIRDLESDLTKVIPADTNLQEQGVVAIVGHFTSAEVETALPFINHKELPLISPAATSESLSDKNDFFFRTIMSSRDDGSVLANHIRSRDLQRILVIATALNPAYVTTYLDGLSKELEIAEFLEYTQLNDIDSRLSRITAEVEAICIIASSIDTGTIAQLLRSKGWLQPLYASGWAGNNDLIHYGGTAVEGLIFVHQINPDLPEIREFSDKYSKIYGSLPGFGAIEAWDSMLYLYTALKIQKRSESLASALRRVHEFRGISGNIVMNSFGDAKRQLYIKTVQDGSIVTKGLAGD